LKLAITQAKKTNTTKKKTDSQTVNNEIKPILEEYKNKYEDPIDQELNLDEFDEFIAKKYEKETNTSILDRMNKFFKYIKKLEYQKIIIVSHGGVMTFGLTQLFGLPMMTLIPYGTIVEKGNCWISYILYNKKRDEFKMITAPTNQHLLL